MPFEKRHEPLLPRKLFLLRMARHGLFAAALVTASLALGIVGYHWIARLDWIDALLNASMILTGMGPVDPMRDASAKLFASAYALFSGVVFLSTIGIVAAPLTHRLLHRFHIERD